MVTDESAIVMPVPIDYINRDSRASISTDSHQKKMGVTVVFFSLRNMSYKIETNV